MAGVLIGLLTEGARFISDSFACIWEPFPPPWSPCATLSLLQVLLRLVRPCFADIHGEGLLFSVGKPRRSGSGGKRRSGSAWKERREGTLRSPCNIQREEKRNSLKMIMWLEGGREESMRGIGVAIRRNPQNKRGRARLYKL